MNITMAKLFKVSNKASRPLLMLLLFNTVFGTSLILRIKDKREVQKIEHKLFLFVDDTSVYKKVLKNFIHQQ